MSRITRLLASTVRKLGRQVPATWLDIERTAHTYIVKRTWPPDPALRRSTLLELVSAIAFSDFKHLPPDPKASSFNHVRQLLDAIRFIDPPSKCLPPMSEQWSALVKDIYAQYEQEFPEIPDEELPPDVLKYC